MSASFIATDPLLAANPRLSHGGPSYPFNNMPGVCSNDPRRTVSNPSIPKPPSSTLYPRVQTPRQLLGHHQLNSDIDTDTVLELIKILETQLADLCISLEAAKGALERVQERLQPVSRAHKPPHELISVSAVHEAAEETVGTLKASITNLERTLVHLRSLSHPIRKLPVEILTHIMQFAVEDEESDRRNELLFWHNTVGQSPTTSRANTLDCDSDFPEPQELQVRRHWHQRFPPPLALSLVCTHWKAVAMNCPSLWKTIHFHLSGQPDVGSKSWDRVRAYLRRARHDPSSPQSSSKQGLSLVFTGWNQHSIHPTSDASFRKVMRLLSDVDPLRRDWFSSTPAHSRRTSTVEPAPVVPSLTPLGLNLDSNLPAPSPPLNDTPAQFKIERFELIFDSLYDHTDNLGLSINADKTWPSKSPKPEEVAFIAKDKVYQSLPHTDNPRVLMTPPYAASLIPWARNVTLCNVQYSWDPPMASRHIGEEERAGITDAYQSLSSLTLLFSRYFPSLLTKPENIDQLGPLQFLKVAPNLQRLEIRLSPAPPPSQATTPAASSPVSISSTLSSVNQAATEVPTITHSNLTHLTISLRDLLAVIPLFLPDRSRQNAPNVLLPSLQHIELLPGRAKLFTQTQAAVERQSMAERIDKFFQLTEAKITHIELVRYSPTPPDCRPLQAYKEEVEFALQQFRLCETLEVWGSTNLAIVLDYFGTSMPKSEEMVSPPILVPTTVTNLPQRVETSPSGPVKFPLASTSELTANPGIPLTNASSPEQGIKTPSPTISQNRRSRKSILGAKEIIASVIATALPSKRRSSAIVGTPESTPRIAVNGLPDTMGDDSIASRLRKKVMSPSPSVQSNAPDTPPTSTRQTSAHCSPERPSPLPQNGFDPARLSNILLLKRLIVHDADFGDDLRKAFIGRGIEVVTYG